MSLRLRPIFCETLSNGYQLLGATLHVHSRRIGASLGPEILCGKDTAQIISIARGI